MNKKAVSEIINTLIIVVISLVLIAFLFVFIRNMITEETQGTKECFDSIGKVLIGTEFTCYKNNELNIFVDVKDIEIDGIYISISDNSNSKSFKITQGAKIENVKNYNDDSYGSELNFPEKNSGKTYVFNLQELGIGNPNSVKIAPIIGTKVCEATDEIFTLKSC